MASINGTLREMRCLVCLILLVTASAGAQDTEDARALLQKTESLARSVKNWRAEVVETSHISGHGINLQDQVHIKIAAQSPLKMRRENSGSDQTILVCDGIESLYMGDGHNYYRGSATTNPDCDFPLSSFYKLQKDFVSASIVAHDQVVLADGNHICDVVRAEWKSAGSNVVRTMCIDPTSGFIWRDVTDTNNAVMRSVETTTFTSYENNPTFPPDTFKISIPPGAVEAKPPI
jgi:outer membrane lipoprotein-sorting protein